MTEQWPDRLYSATQVRQGEQDVARQLQLDMYQLMERAGAAVFDAFTRTYPHSQHILVCCGGGNNGGDGYVVARLARQAGYDVTLWTLGDPAQLTGDAVTARDAWLADGGSIDTPAGEIPVAVDVIIDALLGTGLIGSVRSDAGKLIAMINRRSVPVIAVDIPSGLCADTGNVRGDAVCAAVTVTFIGCKKGLMTGQAAGYTGQLQFASLDISTVFDGMCSPAVWRVTAADIARYLPRRHRSAHKGDHGRILCVGGDHGMGGAIRLAAQAAARSGAGLTAVMTQPDNALAITSAIPEIMAKGWCESITELDSRCRWADVVVLGPGLGQSDWSRSIYSIIAPTEKRLVLDADGLNLLALSPDYKKNRIITPHPGEAARLLCCAVLDVEADRFAAVRALQQKYGGVVVLKGAGTLIDDGTQCWLCAAGNPGMATGGMGDVLSGIIGALIGQGLSLFEAAKCAVWIHSTAADHCAIDGERGMLASDLFPYIRQLVNPR